MFNAINAFFEQVKLPHMLEARVTMKGNKLYNVQTCKKKKRSQNTTTENILF